jgi:hypothetical protein
MLAASIIRAMSMYQTTWCYILEDSHLQSFFVRFQVLTATSMQMVVFWDVSPCSLVEIDQRFRGAYCLHYS